MYSIERRVNKPLPSECLTASLSFVCILSFESAKHIYTNASATECVCCSLAVSKAQATIYGSKASLLPSTSFTLECCLDKNECCFPLNNFTTRTEELTKCYEPLQKLRVRLWPCKIDLNPPVTLCY